MLDDPKALSAELGRLAARVSQLEWSRHDDFFTQMFWPQGDDDKAA
jgi:hypothetical protein